MGLMLLAKKLCLLFLLISASLFSTSLGGRISKLASDQLVKGVGASTTNEHQESEESSLQKEEAFIIHKRLLRVATNDYANYKPAPALVRPPYKLIPN